MDWPSYTGACLLVCHRAFPGRPLCFGSFRSASGPSSYVTFIISEGTIGSQDLQLEGIPENLSARGSYPGLESSAPRPFLRTIVFKHIIHRITKETSDTEIPSINSKFEYMCSGG